ncbi:MAG: hypothetical protein ABEJ98_04395 [Candidatus Nanohaloarchaea archaeon]
MNPENYYELLGENPEDFESGKKIRFQKPVKLGEDEILEAVIAHGSLGGRTTAIFHDGELKIEGKNEVQVLLELFARSENYEVSVTNLETCAVEGCEKKAEYFYNINLPVGEVEYRKTDETDLEGIADKSFDVVKWTGEKKEHKIPFCEEHV